MVSRAGFLAQAGVASSSSRESVETVPGLSLAMVFEGASSRARLDAVTEPRRCGSTRQGSTRAFTFQMDSNATALDGNASFYTISIACHVSRVTSVAQIEATCSCPFRGPGFCKHTAKCLSTLVDDEAETKRRRHDDDDDDDESRSDDDDDDDDDDDPVGTPPLKRSRSGDDEDTRRRRRDEEEDELSCARCGVPFFPSSQRRLLCVKPHPRRSLLADGRCGRCGKAVADVASCFRGAHEASLVVVDAEGWPSSSDDDES